jgi:hypothetical protein
MIEHAIMALGGASVVEITNWIAEHFPSVLTGKTQTWRNSVAGCLSGLCKWGKRDLHLLANRRKLFVKEPVRKNAKRYIWKLRSQVGDADDLKNDFLGKEEPEEEVEEQDSAEEQETETVQRTRPKAASPNVVNGQSFGFGSVVLVKMAMEEMGGHGTGDEVTEWIATTKKDFGVDKKRLGVIVHSILASEQFSNMFEKVELGSTTFRLVEPTS